MRVGHKKEGAAAGTAPVAGGIPPPHQPTITPTPHPHTLSEPPSLAAEEQLLLLDEDEFGPADSKGCTVAQGVFALTNTIVGAGMMALPRVMAELGLFGGIASMAVVYCLAYYSTCAIVRYVVCFVYSTHKGA